MGSETAGGRPVRPQSAFSFLPSASSAARHNSGSHAGGIIGTRASSCSAIDSRAAIRAAFWLLPPITVQRSEEHTPELQSLMRNSYADFSFKKKKTAQTTQHMTHIHTTYQ